jgi:predicted kinase
MPTLTICRGLSGSGKSTWARSQNAVVVSRDDLRAALFPSVSESEYYKAPKDVMSARENFVTKAEHDAIKRALNAGFDVISDNTNIEMRYVNAIAKVGYACGADVEVKVFEVGAVEATRRNNARAASGGRNVPLEAIVRQAERFKPGAKVVEKPVERVYTGTPGKPDAFMYDLDGTAYHMGDKREPYDHNVDVDDVDDTVRLVVNSMCDNSLGCGTMFAVAMSGRKEATRPLTETCLKRDAIWFDDLFMRADDDNRSDDLVKHDLFWEHVAPNYNVRFAIDDRAQVCRMWKRIGIKVFNVAGMDDGEF